MLTGGDRPDLATPVVHFGAAAVTYLDGECQSGVTVR
jgi:hypothetical protein